MREIKFSPRLVVLGVASDAVRLLQMTLQRVHARIRPSASAVKRAIAVPMRREVAAGTQARHCRVSGRHAAADDARQVFRVVLLEVPSEVSHASPRLDVPAFLAFNHGFHGGIGIGIGIDIGIVVRRTVYGGGVRGRRLQLVASGALGGQRLWGGIDGPESPLHGRKRGGRNGKRQAFKPGRRRGVGLRLGWKRGNVKT